MRLSWICVCLLFSLSALQGQARRRERKVIPGNGIHFPEHPLSRDEAERYVFNRKIYYLYRLANPLFPPGVALDVEAYYEALGNDDLNVTLWLSNDDICSEVNWKLDAVSEEGNRAVYMSDEPFPTTGEGIILSLFSCQPKDYVFHLACLDKTKAIVRNGRRVFCNGPYDILFGVYDYPPDRVKWCDAEKDLWKAYGLSFNNENMRFISTGPTCSQR